LFAGAEPFEDVGVVFEDYGEDSFGVAVIFAGGGEAFAEAGELESGDGGFVFEGEAEVAGGFVGVDGE
jgi:hypothetical protein